MVREKEPSDTAKTSVCHRLSVSTRLWKDTRVCQAPAASSLRNRKCRRVGEYRRPSSRVSRSSVTTVNRYSFFCKRGRGRRGTGQVRARAGVARQERERAGEGKRKRVKRVSLF